ncbi:hypothetical protein I308_103314 [Cryptococcus tetragattii IND107]|uniref:Uncharacterized protein n=1 Tax=Cryptococcus tetragattii IND107 TaxID=1296105 RepID=A0ABR3BST0_9TREE
MSRCVMRYAGGALSQAVQAPTECGAGYRRTLCCLMRQEKNMAPFTRRQAQLISQVHGEETPITGIRRLESFNAELGGFNRISEEHIMWKAT